MGIATSESTYAIGFCFPILGAILIALRFYTRKHQRAEIQIDDWLCLPAWFCLAGCCACLLTGQFKDAFKDQPISSPEDATPSQRLLAQVVFALVKLWVIGNFFIKLTILFFYRRIFIGRIFNIATWTLIAFSSVWLVYAFIASVLYCGTHVQANAEGGWAVCPLVGFGIQMGTFVADSVIDFCLLVLPIPFVLKLQLSPAKKAIIVVIFILGGFAFVAGLFNTIVQLVELLQPAIAEKGSFFQGSWLLFYNWPVVEIGVGLIACNLPVISSSSARALLASLRRGWRVSLIPDIRSRLGRRRASWPLPTTATGTTAVDDDGVLSSSRHHHRRQHRQQRQWQWRRPSTLTGVTASISSRGTFGTLDKGKRGSSSNSGRSGNDSRRWWWQGAKGISSTNSNSKSSTAATAGRRRGSQNFVPEFMDSSSDIPLVGRQAQALPFTMSHGGAGLPEGEKTKRYALEPVATRDGKILRAADDAV